jgi:hypothetical protein
LKTLLLSFGLLVLAASNAAGQIQATWDDCALDGGATNKTSACVSSIGTNRYVVSYTMPEGLSNFVAIDATIDVQSDAGAVPPWWDFKNANACRASVASVVIDGSILPGYSGACTDTWDFGATGIGLFTGFARGYRGEPSQARAVFAIARPASRPMSLSSGTTYLAFIWQIGNSNPANCGGCAQPVAIMTTELVLSAIDPTNYSAKASTVTLKGDAYGGCANWQNGTCGSTSTQRSTWGGVKASYR